MTALERTNSPQGDKSFIPRNQRTSRIINEALPVAIGEVSGVVSFFLFSRIAGLTLIAVSTLVGTQFFNDRKS